MATYKVIQDIEAEDKFVGPLTLKQFVFAAIGATFGWLNFLALSKGAVWAIIIFLPPMLLGFFLAIPWSKEQPTEVWVLAKLRFRLKPKARVWNQDGIQELVTITAPKKVEEHLTDNLSQNEVKSRLKALADTIDTRGWAVKNAQVNIAMTEQSSDRLISPTILPKQVAAIDANEVQDMLDENAPVATNFDSMMQASGQIRKEQNIDTMDRVRRGEPIKQPPVQLYAPTPERSLSQPETRPPASGPASYMPPVDLAADESALARQLRERQANMGNATGHLRDLRAKPKPKHPHTSSQNKAQADMTSPATPAIIQGLAQNNDLTVDTVARQANKSARGDDDEVVVSLR
jgi:hypothetical protein